MVVENKRVTTTVRMTEGEARLLADYAAATGRTQSDIVREFIRSLKARLTRLADRKAK